MKVLWNKGEFYTQVYEKPFCTQEPRGFSHREVQLLRFVANDQSFVHILDAHDAFITTSCTSDTCVVPSCINVFVVDHISPLDALQQFEKHFGQKPNTITIHHVMKNRLCYVTFTNETYCEKTG